MSIGLPVYNGERYLREAIDSILGQTYTDLELIISDNASTDATQKICLEYTHRDRRIRYFRNNQNIGAARNFNRTLELARGTYFKWAAADDICMPEYLEQCVHVLDTNPNIVLCSTRVVFIDECSREIHRHELVLNAANDSRASRRFASAAQLEHWCFDVFGLTRTDVLRRTPAIASFIGSDRALLAELCLYGRMVILPESLFLSRDHVGRSIRCMRLYERAAWFDPRMNGRACLPHWRLWMAYLGALRRVRVPAAERLCGLLHLVRWALHYWRSLVCDVRHLGRSGPWSGRKVGVPRRGS